MNQEEFKIQSLLKQEADFLIDCVKELDPWLIDIFINIQEQNQKRNKQDNHRNQGNKRNQIDNQLEKEGFGHSQIKHLMRATAQASGLKELCLFIRYQMGRDDQRKNWNKAVRNKTLGEAVIEQLNQIEAKAKSLVSADDPPAFQRQLFLRMAERFFHYWSWQYRFLQSQALEQRGRTGR
ncbi:MAG: hypothetical protein BAA01_01160 [Bacillus thermozeamaize]|uniref:Uncharacterized protein n=1 Tax=Bacillus thermozeamaize TaxID=230954 RepID=A0A1Y3PF84_9BACI|nr:MAG: hypothetical protein BAA01_01160 [Bacillus thermozeamaize]